jgi:hypothetical protein
VIPNDRARSRRRWSSAGVKCAPCFTARTDAGSWRGRPRRLTADPSAARSRGSCKFATLGRSTHLRAQASSGQPLPAPREPASAPGAGRVSRAGKHGWLLTSEGRGSEAPGAVEQGSRKSRWGNTAPVAPSRAAGCPGRRSRQGCAYAGLAAALDPISLAGPTTRCGRGGGMGSGSGWAPRTDRSKEQRASSRPLGERDDLVMQGKRGTTSSGDAEPLALDEPAAPPPPPDRRFAHLAGMEQHVPRARRPREPQTAVDPLGRGETHDAAAVARRGRLRSERGIRGQRVHPRR